MQTVVRTNAIAPAYRYDPGCTRRLKEYLEAGWRVVMCNEIGTELEYILEKNDLEERSNDL